MTSSRDEILAKIKRAVAQKNRTGMSNIEHSGSVYPELPSDLLAHFKSTLELLKGEVVLCANSEDIQQKLRGLVEGKQWKNVACIDKELIEQLQNSKVSSEFNEDMEAGITTCEFLVAHTGSVVVSSKQVSGRRMNVFPPEHIIIAKASQLLPRIENAMESLMNKYDGALPSLITNITGPSRTADIEKTLVMGAHGPKSLYVFVDTSC
ncbi:hypothetical protein EMN47_15255 [Prolixibacteraceae bacterium JC049]|nr:hypothetical protein [Prolixibacteraceae bacterium JC049]